MARNFVSKYFNANVLENVMRPFVWRLIYHQGVGLEHRLYLNQLGMNK